MDFKMSESTDIHPLTSTRHIVADTCRAYGRSAHEYAAATRDYDAYPGLREEIVAFEGKLPHGRPVLDLGCGGGRDSRLLAGLRRRVIAGDICLPMLTSARELSADYGAAVDYTCLDMLALPFSDGALGGIWASGSMLHLPSTEIARGLSEVLRTLSADGVAAISMRAGDREGWREGGTLQGRRWFTHVQPGEFAASMIAAGFGDVQTRFSGRPGWFVTVGYKRSAA